MKISRHGEKIKIIVGGVGIEHAKEFCYLDLGGLIDAGVKCQKEIKKRIAMGERSLSK